jgi:hypothetical protein
MRAALLSIFACLACLVAMAGCDVPQPPKPSPFKLRVNGEQQLRDSLAHTNPELRRP